MYSMTIFEIPQNNIKKLSNIFIMILANSTFMQYNIDSSSSWKEKKGSDNEPQNTFSWFFQLSMIGIIPSMKHKN